MGGMALVLLARHDREQDIVTTRGVDPMAEALILEFAGLTDADYRAVNAHLGIDMDTGKGDWPAGMLSHAAGPGEGDSWVVAEVWSSRNDQEAFMSSRLGAALGAAGVTAVPAVRWVPLVAYHVSEA
jgi:hypothetical protein